MQANPPILSGQRLMEMKEKVVSNVLEIRDHNRVLLQNLLIRQQDQHPLVKGIGDVILNSALEWGQDYIRYTSDHVFGEAEVNDEKSRNPSFAELIQVSFHSIFNKLIHEPQQLIKFFLSTYTFIENSQT